MGNALILMDLVGCQSALHLLLASPICTSLTLAGDFTAEPKEFTVILIVYSASASHAFLDFNSQNHQSHGLLLVLVLVDNSH